MMENCLVDTIVVSKDDVNEVEHHPVERSDRYRKLDSHISMQRQALFRYKQYDRMFLHSRLPKTLQPWNRHPTNTITFDENFRLCLMPLFFIGISTISWSHSIVLRIIDTINVNKISHLKRKFSSFLLFENLFEPNLQIFSA